MVEFDCYMIDHSIEECFRRYWSFHLFHFAYLTAYFLAQELQGQLLLVLTVLVVERPFFVNIESYFEWGVLLQGGHTDLVEYLAL